jgi:alpha-galactosidase
MMNTETKEILTNREVIDVDQDSLGVQGFRFNSNQDDLEVWVKPLAHGDWAVCFLNRSDKARRFDYDWSKNVVDDGLSRTVLDANSTIYNIRDLWKKRDLGTTQKSLSAEVDTHDVLLLRLRKQR